MEDEYPTSSTIPFPYPSGPYPQQAALMDTMLQSLRIVDEEQEQQLQQQKEQQLLLPENNNKYKGKTKSTKKKANVMILESPTGTGKSLSLACASLAWLRYREKCDLNHFKKEKIESEGSSRPSDNKQKQQDTTNNNSSSDSNYKSNTKQTTKSWLKEWIPPEQIQKQNQMKQIQTKCYQRATSSRNQLDQELDHIRTKISNRIRQQSKTMNKTDVILNQHNTKKMTMVMTKGIREDIVKESIDQVLKMERWTYSKDSRKKKSKLSSIKHVEEKKDEEKLDFCVDEYHSDKDLHSINCYSDDDEDDDNGHGAIGDKEIEDDNVVTKSIKGNEKSKSTTKIRQSAQSILDGGQLDGSGFNRRRQYNHKSNVEQSSSRTSTATSDDQTLYPTTIGGCDPGTGVRKIIYAARTHSQLSQFVNEIRRTKWGDDVRVVALGGRKLLCGNTDVSGGKKMKRSEAMITEKCLDLQKGLVTTATPSVDDNKVGHVSSSTANNNDIDEKKKRKQNTKGKKTSCPLLSSKEAISTLALHMLAKPSDIEDLVSLGQKSQTCAYYASRESLKAAEVVVVPYNTLLSKPARQAVGLSLQSSLVIIDEAHNIPETLRGISSCQLTLPIIEGASAQLTSYVKRYSSRLAGKNVFFLGQLRKILTALSKHLKSKKVPWSKRGEVTPKSIMITSTELFFTLKLDNINLFNVMKYLERSRLAQKLHGFTNMLQGEGVVERNVDVDDSDFISKHISCMSLVETFLKCLTGTDREGRVIIDRPDLNKDENCDELRRSGGSKPCFRYLLLDPSVHFNDVIDEAHAIVLAGGTLRPFPHIATELFGHERSMVEIAMNSENECKSETTRISNSTISRQLTTFSCGHVVSPSNVMVTCLSRGPNNIAMDFRHSNRTAESLCNELGLSIIEIAKEVPGGFVVFFPSYTYEAHVVRHWKKSGLFSKINQCKKIFREPKSAGDVEKTLGMYSNCAIKNDGAILLCVINGKMSEGINFANDMARCVLICGLPYPDITDPELKEKMQLLDKDSKHNKQSISGSSYYQNLCMRAVNQSIGRAIRHINDYAAIVLADVRYVTDPRIWTKLPAWLKSDKNKPLNLTFEQNKSNLRSFFQTIGPQSN